MAPKLNYKLDSAPSPTKFENQQNLVQPKESYTMR